MKSDSRFTPERVEKLRQRVPRGQIVVESLRPIRGVAIDAVTFGDLGLTPGAHREAA